VKRVVNLVLDRQQEHAGPVAQQYKKELQDELKKPNDSLKVVDDFIKSIDNFYTYATRVKEDAEGVRKAAEGARKEANKHRTSRLDHLAEEIKLGDQLLKAKEKIKELEIEIEQLNGELNNAKVARMVAEGDRIAEERVPSPEEVALKKEEDILVLKSNEKIKEINLLSGKISAAQKGIDANKDVPLHQYTVAYYTPQLEQLEQEKEQIKKDLERKQNALGRLRECPVCTRRASADSGIGTSSVGS
jgi:chromosome segregation ATPase